MTSTQCEHGQATAVGKTPDPKAAEGEERREIFMAALPMLIVFAMWLVAQVWLMGPPLFR